MHTTHHSPPHDTAVPPTDVSRETSVKRKPSLFAPIVLKKSISWAVIVGFVAIALGLIVGLKADDSSSAPQTLPDNSDSATVASLSDEFPGSDTLAATIIVDTGDNPVAPQLDTLAAAVTETLDVTGLAASDAPVQFIPVADNLGQAAVQLPGDIDGTDLTDAVEQVREELRTRLPEGDTAYVSGPAGFAADSAAAFKGANFTLLAVTALVVAVLLILTYRSPTLWLVPLLGIGLADRAASSFTSWLAETTGWFQADGSTAGITSVLVFGAGTNYALLLVSRYREELRRYEDHREALAASLKGTVPAIVSSNLTVVIALLTLLAATIPSYRSLGLSSAIGLLFALSFGLLLLPALLAVTGRFLFWPKIPRHTDAVENDADGAFYRVAKTVAKKPAAVLAIMVVLLGALSFGIAAPRFGLSTTQQFRTQSEAVDGQTLLAERTGMSASGPAQIVVDSSELDAASTVVEANQLRPLGPPTQSVDGNLTKLVVAIPGDPGSQEQLDKVAALRADLEANAPSAIVGGEPAQTLDSRDATIRDMKVVIPLIFLAVFLILVMILRALVAPVLLLGAAALSTAAALGVGALASKYVFDFPGLAYEAPLYAVLFLIALGIDYTVFLVLRAREEADTHGTKYGMVRAVGLTGGVITSAGIVLAAVFVVLGVLPLITLTQVGIIVGIGILLDTFLVRTLVVPALFELLGDTMWKPGKAPAGNAPANT
ncbi:MMPL family transporter [Corynebacterium choanae]|uniref:Membrane protein YdfJ n=1 Tax=Corynebacterium choanae TaxID=1862358 RepID=A0A3G6JCD3_9CORY|nr:MMPL family transporter [Corynebacterium choanae]AZA14718.1 Membrane protein YdfJ [Corynebacterium choanae]